MTTQRTKSPATQGRLSLERPTGSRTEWPLSRNVIFLNHGSFGSCPARVLACQAQLRRRMERQPVQFLVRELESQLDHARAALAAFLGASPNDLVFVPNATAGVNTVLRSLRFRQSDEILVTNHEYNACRNALEFAAQQHRAKVVVIKIPFPLPDSDHVREAVLAKVTRNTRLALLDHVTSPTALVFPIEHLVRDLAERGIDVLVDGAHAPGMVPLHLDRLGAAFYTGNCHKWICAPKGAGFLHVRADRQRAIRPLVISHAANSPRKDRSRFLLEFGWTGTWDPTAMLSVPEALDEVGSMHPGGWRGHMRRNHELAVSARRHLCDTLGWSVPCPDSMLGSMAALPLSDAGSEASPLSPLYLDPLQDRLLAEFGIEVPIIPWPAPPKRLIRFSCQAYNALSDYRRLGAALQAVFSLRRGSQGAQSLRPIRIRP